MVRKTRSRRVKRIRTIELTKRRFSFEDYEKSIRDLLEKMNGMIHHSDLAAYLRVSPSTAREYLLIYAKRHGIEYHQGWLFKSKESEVSAAA